MTQDKLLLGAAACMVSLWCGSAVAADPHAPGTAGQPSQSCQVTTVTPGNAMSAGGSAFNPNGNAGTHYAGQQPQNSGNAKSVAQYDVACFQNTTRASRVP